jgi:hypothetical protein
LTIFFGTETRDEPLRGRLPPPDPRRTRAALK